jgi:hypothetical protein
MARRGGCHERSSQRSTTLLLLNRVGYRDCDRGRDTDHLTVSGTRFASLLKARLRRDEDRSGLAILIGLVADLFRRR